MATASSAQAPKNRFLLIEKEPDTPITSRLPAPFTRHLASLRRSSNNDSEVPGERQEQLGRERSPHSGPTCPWAACPPTRRPGKPRSVPWAPRPSRGGGEMEVRGLRCWPERGFQGPRPKAKGSRKGAGVGRRSESRTGVAPAQPQRRRLPANCGAFLLDLCLAATWSHLKPKWKSWELGGASPSWKMRLRCREAAGLPTHQEQREGVRVSAQHRSPLPTPHPPLPQPAALTRPGGIPGPLRQAAGQAGCALGAGRSGGRALSPPAPA